MTKFEDLMSKLATDSSENPMASQEDIKEIVDDYQGKNAEIELLKQSLKDKTDEYEKLKSRVIDNLFSSSSSQNGSPMSSSRKPISTNEDETDETAKKTFKDLINPNYAIRNK